MVKLREQAGKIKSSFFKFKKEHKIVFWILLVLFILTAIGTGALGFALLIILFIITPWIYYKILKCGVPPVFKGIENWLQKLFKVNKN